VKSSHRALQGKNFTPKKDLKFCSCPVSDIQALFRGQVRDLTSTKRQKQAITRSVCFGFSSYFGKMFTGSCEKTAGEDKK